MRERHVKTTKRHEAEKRGREEERRNGPDRRGCKQEEGGRMEDVCVCASHMRELGQVKSAVSTKGSSNGTRKREKQQQRGVTECRQTQPEERRERDINLRRKRWNRKEEGRKSKMREKGWMAAPKNASQFEQY